MAAPSLRSVFSFGMDVMSSILDATTNAITVGLGDSTSNSQGPSGNTWMQHTGFASVAAPPSSGAPSCQTVTIRQGDQNIVIASKDYRTCDRYANLAPGECSIFATVGQARVMCKADGSVTLYTTAGNVGGTGDPAVYLKVATTGLLFVAPFGKIMFDATGLHMKHGDANNTNFRIDAGGVSLPGPLSALGGYFTVLSPTITLNGLVNLGASMSGTYNPVAWGLNENPLTSPLNPIGVAPLGFGSPCGIFLSPTVRAAGLL